MNNKANNAVIGLTWLLMQTASYAQSTSATDQLHVGDMELNGAFIEPYDAKFDFFSEGENGESILSGRWTDHVRHLNIGGEKYLSRKVVRYPAEVDAEKDLERVMVGHSATLAPLSVHQSIGRDLETLYSLHYDDKQVTGSLANSSVHTIRTLKADLSIRPFDLSFWATLAMSLPFREGFSAQLPTFSPAGGGSIHWETFSVLGQESLEVDGTDYDTWVVQAEPSTWKFWVRKEAPYIVKIDHPDPSTPGNRAISILTEWTLL